MVHGMTITHDAREPAYIVPFVLERNPPVYRLLNVSLEAVHGVTFTLHGAGMMATNSPEVIDAGGALEVRITGQNLPRAAILVVRWFRPNGVEYLWRVSF
jgi:hypothetical protein